MTVRDLVKVFAPEYGYIYLVDDHTGGVYYWYTLLDKMGFTEERLGALEITKIDTNEATSHSLLVHVNRLYRNG